MRCGMGPTGTCVRVVLGMVQADRYRVSDLMRHDGRQLRTLVGRGEVRAALVGGLVRFPCVHAAATTPAQRLNVSLRSFHPDVTVFPW